MSSGNHLLQNTCKSGCARLTWKHSPSGRSRETFYAQPRILFCHPAHPFLSRTPSLPSVRCPLFPRPTEQNSPGQLTIISLFPPPAFLCSAVPSSQSSLARYSPIPISGAFPTASLGPHRALQSPAAPHVPPWDLRGSHPQRCRRAQDTAPRHSSLRARGSAPEPQVGYGGPGMVMGVLSGNMGVSEFPGGILEV